jgi:hypothetical protein
VTRSWEDALKHHYRDANDASHNDLSIVGEAADEIERLRALVDELRLNAPAMLRAQIRVQQDEIERLREQAVVNDKQAVNLKEKNRALREEALKWQRHFVNVSARGPEELKLAADNRALREKLEKARKIIRKRWGPSPSHPAVIEVQCALDEGEGE